MANTFLTEKALARKILPRLQANLVLPALATRDYDEEYTDLGDTISVKKPTILEAKDFTAGSSVTRSDVTENAVDVTLDKIATVDIKLSAFEAALNWSEEKFMTDFIEPAAVALAEKINKAGLQILGTKAGGNLGTIGTTPDGMDDLSEARKFLNVAKAPMMDRHAIWDPSADAKFTELSNLFKVNEAGTTEALRNGIIGDVYGLHNWMAQDVLNHTTSAAGTILVDGAATAGAEMIHLDGITAALTVGDCFTIANDTTVYKVWKVGALDTADQDVYITPALQKNAADNAAVTMKSGAKVFNCIFQKAALVFVNRPLLAPVNGYTVSDGGMSMRVVRGYDIDKKEELLSMDVLYNYEVVYPELAATYFG